MKGKENKKRKVEKYITNTFLIYEKRKI